MSEDYVLRHWAMETITRKLHNGVAFDLMRRGFGKAEMEAPAPITAAEEKELYGVYL